MSVLRIRILIANSWRRWCRIFKGLSRDGGRADFFKDLPASLFNDDLSNEPTVLAARSISLYNTFKGTAPQPGKEQISKYLAMMATTAMLVPAMRKRKMAATT
jgi:hypothetical protein